MANSRTRIRWCLIAAIGFLLISAVVLVARKSLRHFAAHHAESIGIQADSYNRKVVTSLNSRTELVILGQIVCCDDYLRGEYDRTKDISVFALQQSLYRGSLSTSDCQDEMSKGAVGFFEVKK